MLQVSCCSLLFVFTDSIFTAKASVCTKIFNREQFVSTSWVWLSATTTSDMIPMIVKFIKLRHESCSSKNKPYVTRCWKMCPSTDSGIIHDRNLKEDVSDSLQVFSPLHAAAERSQLELVCLIKKQRWGWKLRAPLQLLSKRNQLTAAKSRSSADITLSLQPFTHEPRALWYGKSFVHLFKILDVIFSL